MAVATLPTRPKRRASRALPASAEIQDHGGRRLAEILHDGLAQSLTGVSLLAQALATDLAARPDSRSESALGKAVVAQIAACVEQARALARLADPDRVTGGSLQSALQDLALALPARRQQPLTVSVSVPDRFVPQPVAAGLVRIALHVVLLVRESAAPGEVALELGGGPGRLVLECSGRAVEKALAQRDAAPQYWRLVERRARALGGSVAIRRERGRARAWALTLGASPRKAR